MHMEEWSARWLRMQRIKPRTRESYESLLRLYILPALGRIELAELSAEAIQAAIDAPLAAGHGRTAEQVYTLLVQLCRAAVRAGHIERSPMDAILRPYHVPTPTAWWLPEDAARFLRLRQLALDPHLVVWTLALTCGLRRGELCGLQWQDIDPQQCTIRVTRQRITLADGRTVAAPPKSRSSARTLAIPADLAGWLAAHRPAAGGYVAISSSTGRPITPGGLDSAWRRAVRASGLPPITLHGCRHTCGAAAVRAGVAMRVLQDIMGHSSDVITSQIYAHVDTHAQRAALDSITGLMI